MAREITYSSYISPGSLVLTRLVKPHFKPTASGWHVSISELLVNAHWGDFATTLEKFSVPRSIEPRFTDTPN